MHKHRDSYVMQVLTATSLDVSVERGMETEEVWGLLRS